MQTLSSFARIHSDLSLQVEEQDEVSPYQDPFCYLEAESCSIFPLAREMQTKIKVLILPEHGFSKSTVLVISSETSES